MRKTFVQMAALLALTVFFASMMLAQSKRSTGSKWSSPVSISPYLQPDPTRGSQLNDVAVNANGLALAAWDQFTYTAVGPYTIGVAVQSGAKWSAPLTISPTAGFSMSPKVAVGNDGTMAVSWIYQDTTFTENKVQVAVKTAGASTWITSTLAQGSVGGVQLTAFVPIAVDPNGNITAAWTMWDGTRHLIQTATMPKGGGWSPSTTVSGTDDGLNPGLAINSAGDAAIAYSLSAYSGYLTGTSAKYVFRSGLNGAWTAPVTVSETLSSSVGYITAPQVALDANGLATVVYGGYGLEGVRQLSSSTWTTPRTVLAAPNSVSSFTSTDLALDRNGNAVVVASIFDATVNIDRSSVYVTLGTPSGNWGAQTRITDPAVPVDAYAARAAISPDGVLVMVGWIDHYHGTVQVSKLVGGVWTSPDTIGRGTAFSSFQETLGLDIGSATSGRAIWKSWKGGTQVQAASYGN